MFFFCGLIIQSKMILELSDHLLCYALIDFCHGVVFHELEDQDALDKSYGFNWHCAMGKGSTPQR